jgi:dTDP-4-amino-4,6-dideoxygalactose transaminase
VQVPQFDLTAQYSELRDEILPALDRVCATAAFVSGREVDRFEDAFADYCGTRYCVALNSGTSALHLALLACGVQPGDEVVTAANTFTATAEAIAYTGATPTFSDVDPATGNMDPARLEATITERTRAVVPVHLYGRPAALAEILAIADRHGLAVIEDACQAHGARSGGRRVGGFGRAAAFSFYPAKNLGAFGQGGALTTDDEEVAGFARTMRDHGRVGDYVHDAVGFNYRMDGFQGAVLHCKLGHLDRWTATRQELAGIYRTHLHGARLDLPRDAEQDECVYHQFVAWVEDRDAVRRSLHDRGIGTSIHYPVPLHLQKAWAGLGYTEGDFPHAERACARALSLPLFPEMSTEQVEYAAGALREVVGSA